MKSLRSFVLAALLYAGATQAATITDPAVLDACPGYKATNVVAHGATLVADLELAGEGCNVFGKDVAKLRLEVTYETKTRIHLKITDPSQTRYEIPSSVFPRPQSLPGAVPANSALYFNYTTNPFSFTISRSSTHEPLFSTASHPLIFEPQYLRLKTNLPADANIYGLGEHTDPFRLPDLNYTRTLWSRDAFGVPSGSNLYGNHPIYFEHRPTGTHGVFLANSNGMDIKIDQAQGGTTLEYNVIGGVFDLYFLAGSENDPREVVRQYAEVVGKPAEVPYWGLGLHQCRFGYTDYVDVAGVITNYSAAGIPLETMWTDIDYMYQRRIFTTDPDYFPLARMREIVDYLHKHDQRYILMTDPAVAYLNSSGTGTGSDSYGVLARGLQQDIFLKNKDGSLSLGVVWPGVTVFPDWFNPKTQRWWNDEFARFYSPQTGIDIDGAWIDMNEPASFCNYPCTNPFAQAAEQGLPPNRTTPPPPPNVPIFNSSSTPQSLLALQRKAKREDILSVPDHSGDNLLEPPYAIKNDAGMGALSDKTAWTDAVHWGGLVEYDTHNLYGTMMSTATHNAMLARRPGKKTLIITRSTFAGAGRSVGKWLGDNLSDWEHLKNSIAGMLGFASIYQVPMVGADVCGFGSNTTESLCARWAALGGWYPFFRNHNIDTGIPQEFYRWPVVAAAARKALDTRYRLLDYIYTAFHTAHLTGNPILSPLWYLYPKDTSTYPIDLQFFYGDSLLVCPVVEENATSVSCYLPKDRFYNFYTLETVEGQGQSVTVDNVGLEDGTPVWVKGGSILPLREKGAMTTTLLRKTPFEIVVAPSLNGTATGTLYFDDGESVDPSRSTTIDFSYAKGKLRVSGKVGYPLGVGVGRVRIAGMKEGPKVVKVDGKFVAKGNGSVEQKGWGWSGGVLDVWVSKGFEGGFVVEFA